MAVLDIIAGSIMCIVSCSLSGMPAVVIVSLPACWMPTPCNVVIAHEYALFVKWEHEPAQHSNKTWLFNALYNNSRFSMYRGLRTQQALKKGYTLAIPGSWQGRFDLSSGISVIGDKSGGM